MASTANRTTPMPERILQAAAELLDSGGIEALSTRAVATAAGLQQPAIFRQFGDKEGLLDAVTNYILMKYLDKKREIMAASDDPVDDLRRLWDLHIEFGVTHPDCYQLTYGRPHHGKVLSAVKESTDLLRQEVSRLGDHGMLRMSVERATDLFHSAGVGMVLTQIIRPEAERDPELPAIARENAIAAIVNEGQAAKPTPPELAGRAAALREALRLKEGMPLTPGENAILGELLDRLSNHRDTDAESTGTKAATSRAARTKAGTTASAGTPRRSPASSSR